MPESHWRNPIIIVAIIDAKRPRTISYHNLTFDSEETHIQDLLQCIYSIWCFRKLIMSFISFQVLFRVRLYDISIRLNLPSSNTAYFFLQTRLILLLYPNSEYYRVIYDTSNITISSLFSNLLPFRNVCNIRRLKTVQKLRSFIWFSNRRHCWQVCALTKELRTIRIRRSTIGILHDTYSQLQITLSLRSDLTLWFVTFDPFLAALVRGDRATVVEPHRAVINNRSPLAERLRVNGGTDVAWTCQVSTWVDQCSISVFSPSIPSN